VKFELGADPLTAIEPDQRLADFLRTGNPDRTLKVVVTPFEDAALEKEAFDLGVSATAHRLDEDSALVNSTLSRTGRANGPWFSMQTRR
jgi:hypothetical protein